MKRYLLFTGFDYQATEQGWDGFRGDFDTIGEIGIAVDELVSEKSGMHDWLQIVDTDAKEIIERGRVFQWKRARARARDYEPVHFVSKEG